MLNKAQEHCPFRAKAHDCQPEVIAEFRTCPTAHIPQFDAFEIPPHAFIRIGVGRVAGQLFQAEPCRSPVQQKLLHGLTAMDANPIPDHGQCSGNLSQQVPQKTDNARPVKGRFAHPGVQLTGVGDTTDHRELISGEGYLEARCLASGRIGSHATWEEPKTRLINPDDRPLLGYRRFFTSGQRSLYHASTASALRWVAWEVGSWGVQFSCFNNRLTCVG